MRMTFLPLLACFAVVPVAAASPYECLREIRTLPCEKQFDFRKRLERLYGSGK